MRKFAIALSAFAALGLAAPMVTPASADDAKVVIRKDEPVHKKVIIKKHEPRAEAIVVKKHRPVDKKVIIKHED